MWAELTPTDAVIPPARKQHTMVAGTSSIYVFGGVGDNGEPLSDLFQFNLGKLLCAQRLPLTLHFPQKQRRGLKSLPQEQSHLQDFHMGQQYTKRLCGYLEGLTNPQL